MLTRTSALGFIYFTTKLLEDNFRNNLLFTAVAGTAGAIATASALLGGQQHALESHLIGCAQWIYVLNGSFHLLGFISCFETTSVFL